MRDVGRSLRQGGAVIDQASCCKPGQDLGAAKSDVPVREDCLGRPAPASVIALGLG